MIKWDQDPTAVLPYRPSVRAVATSFVLGPFWPLPDARGLCANATDDEGRSTLLRQERGSPKVIVIQIGF